MVVDGERVEAERGEPIAVAIAASGRLALGRSVKYHRPRGAVCYTGRCDGCLMRVNGRQSEMTCRVPAEEGVVVETQNVVGSAERDLLAATDWFFPRGMKHHEMFTWNSQVNRLMQRVARRVAGVGKLPEKAAPLADSPVREVDVLVVGGGPAGLRAAAVCAERGLVTALVDEAPRVGGSLAWWPGGFELEGEALRGPALASRLAETARRAGATLHAQASAVGVYDPWEDTPGAGDPPEAAPDIRTAPPVVIVDDPDHLRRFRPRRLVIAAGRHEGASAFAGSDAPGILDVRGACTLLSYGVLPGERVVLAGEGRAIEALGAALKEAGASVLGPLPAARVSRARGRPSVTRVELSGETQACDALVMGAPTSAVFELAAQAGVRVTFRGEGYELEADPGDGRTAAPDVRVVGAAAGVDGLAEAMAQAEHAAAAIVEELGR